MQNRWSALVDKAAQVATTSSNKLADIVTKQTHRFTLTGLSRSGKSMLFTSILTMLKSRNDEGYVCLPLLRTLPPEDIIFTRIEPLEGFKPFPLTLSLEALANQEWPAPTDEAYGFKLIIRVQETHSVKRKLLPHTDVIFEFVDYPGEWLTDLPMLSKSYAQWSDTAWAQLSSGPQQYYAEEWKAFVNRFDFEVPPTRERIGELVECYTRYLKVAKSNGISMLQPGSFLLDTSEFDRFEHGFAPLPSSITSDISHPWFEVFNAHYQKFGKDWLSPIKEDVFKETEKQIILVDLFEGLNHSRQHLYQLKETLSHLADAFVYGKQSWFAKRLGKSPKIGKVAFVATKSDLLPAGEHDNLLALLEQITEGARAKFADKPIAFEHFLVSAIKVTDEGSTSQALRYQDKDLGYVEATFESVPTRLKDMESDAHFPVLNVAVPKDFKARILAGRGLDRLFQYLLTNEEQSDGKN